jgi:hypothetical protein
VVGMICARTLREASMTPNARSIRQRGNKIAIRREGLRRIQVVFSPSRSLAPGVGGGAPACPIVPDIS